MAAVRWLLLVSQWCVSSSHGIYSLFALSGAYSRFNLTFHRRLPGSKSCGSGSKATMQLPLRALCFSYTRSVLCLQKHKRDLGLNSGTVKIRLHIFFLQWVCHIVTIYNADGYNHRFIYREANPAEFSYSYYSQPRVQDCSPITFLLNQTES